MKSVSNGTAQENAKQKRFFLPGIFVFIILAFCIAIAALLLFFSAGRPGTAVKSFDEGVLALSEGWTLTDSSGTSKAIQLPYTVEYGKDGKYILSGVLPDCERLISSPTLCFYSNYTDFKMVINGETVCVYPDSERASVGATGNTYHFVRLSSDCAGKTIQIHFTCQLGDAITYLLKAPLLGAKASMLNVGINKSLPCILLAGCMLVLAVLMAVCYLALKRRLKLNDAMAYTSLFAVIFAFYVFCETYFAQLVYPNGYALFSATLMLLALLPIPLFGLFSEDVSSKFRKVPIWLMILCSANFAVQVILNYTGLLSLRVMLPATHATIIVSIFVMITCLLMSDRSEKPQAGKKLLTALPMIVGGILDIILLMINRPSFNNSLWFTIGVTIFIIIQFITFIRSFFTMYRTSLEAEVLRDMAYSDMLTGIGNRNAYEHKLKELSESNALEGLCCIMVDINDLKLINDKYGHSGGDTAIAETSSLLKRCLPDRALCFRTGGDEFVALIDGFDEDCMNSVTQKLTKEAERCGKLKSIPLSIAVGTGRFQPKDDNILDFIRRVDANMYSAKRAIKCGLLYPFYSE